MNLFLRLFLFLIITIFWYVGLFWYSLPFLFWYSFKCQPYELLLIGLLIDVQFMTISTLPMYTLFSFGWIILIAWLRPKLIVYTSTV
ncbi:hypothetical protein CO026_02430 [Candidatus Kaiserbacteria bacterium CG_4_9_14_0_2_um_filter_41_32]|uniref:Uncharacterized protein n=1 Tax=Candidatus Kaiserbacteria bacterium CG_4_9_14_0_2_um_filter_41_32 TaxID=1974601 RepID=A0A2M8FEH7_9BACT|nr:MAG: hypothetical protein CO026_02430 [Candidatus Kaiserbacteria bacterium CG_4_9_14_0_2_um_filter_41_32]